MEFKHNTSYHHKIHINPRNYINVISRLIFCVRWSVLHHLPLSYSNIILKISRHIVLVHQIKNFMPPDVLKSVYFAHIHSLLTYCNSIWSTLYCIHLTPLKSQLKKVVRIITSSIFLEHTNPLFNQTKLLKINDITKLAIATYMYNNKNYILNLLPSHDYSTPHRDHLTLPIHRLSKFQHSTFYLGRVMCYSIPLQVQEVPSLNTFKTRLKNYTLSTAAIN